VPSARGSIVSSKPSLPFLSVFGDLGSSIGNKVRPSQSWSMSRQLVELIDQEACAPPTELTNQTGQECENSNQQ
jgi:hypothetical protein